MRLASRPFEQGARNSKMLNSVVNFRDFGGFPSRFGGSVVRNRLFRSGAVASADQTDIKRLHDLDFDTVIDLRYAGERDEEPSPWPVEKLDRVFFHDGDHKAEAPHMEPLRQGLLDEQGSDRIYRELYRDLPFDQHYPALFKCTFERLLVADGPMLVHCSAGKDRTGMLVALIQYALGVYPDAIMANYMQSRHAPGLIAMAEPAALRLADRFGLPVNVELMRHLLDVKETYLLSFFDEIEQRCGTIDAYLATLGLDEDAQVWLRARWLTA